MLADLHAYASAAERHARSIRTAAPTECEVSRDAIVTLAERAESLMATIVHRRHNAAHCEALARTAENSPDGKCRGATAAQWRAAAASELEGI